MQQSARAPTIDVLGVQIQRTIDTTERLRGSIKFPQRTRLDVERLGEIIPKLQGLVDGQQCLGRAIGRQQHGSPQRQADCVLRAQLQDGLQALERGLWAVEFGTEGGVAGQCVGVPRSQREELFIGAQRPLQIAQALECDS